jgi:4-methyl-5(b-hydroxyethyl)-thiazole monophosphate biosynthesis
MEKKEKKVAVLLAAGFEEVEAVTPIDYLRRAGITVETLSITCEQAVTGSRGIPVIADRLLADAAPAGPLWDGILLPGGIPGAPNLAASQPVNDLVKAVYDAGNLVCAICASPAVVLSPLGILKGRRFTCYPGFQEKAPEGVWVNENVVADRQIITASGAGTAALWALEIIRALLDDEAARKVSSATLLDSFFCAFT